MKGDIKNYRKKYKRYYGIDFDNNYVIHHLDFDRTNNDISNLLLLPKELHQKYHFYLQAVGNNEWKTGKLEINIRIDKHGRYEYYSDHMLVELLETIKECQKWLAYKEQLDFNKHNTELLQRCNNGNI